MKKLFISLLVLSISLTLICSPAKAKTLAEIIESGKIVIGVAGDYPPWGVINAKGKFEGWEIDMCRKLAEYLFGDPNKAELVAVTPANRIPFLVTSKIDIIWSTMGYTKERAKKIDYSIPYFVSGVQLLAKKGSGIKSIQDLKGKKVLVKKGTTASQGLTKLVPEAIQVKFDKTSEALQALRDDRGVAFAEDDILLFKLALDNPGTEVVGEVFNSTPWGIGFRKGEKDIEAYVNLAVKQMYYTQFIQTDLRKWWKGQELDQYIKRIDDMFKK